LLGGLFPSFPITLFSIIFPTSTLPSLSAPSSSSIFTIFPDFNKTHRSAAIALSEARQEARDVGIERREGVRKRVKEMAKDTGESTTPEQQ
jgi:hypothetical protein